MLSAENPNELFLSETNIILQSKAELLQLKPHPFICMRNCTNKTVGN